MNEIVERISKDIEKRQIEREEKNRERRMFTII